MKLFYTILFLVVSTAVRAEEVPAALKDATITVLMKDGSKANFDANDWKVVPRVDKPRAPQIVEVDQKNRVRFMGGVGPDGYHLKSSSSDVNVSYRTKTVFGLGYERKVLKHWSLGAQAITNGTYLLDLGFDF